MACWRSHSAIANFGIVRQFMYASSQTKFVAVEYGDQHATSVRSPERRRSTHQLRALLSNHGNNRNNQERPLHRDGRSGIDRRGWKQIPCRKANGTLPLRRFHRETVLRRHALEDRISSRSESCAGIKGIIFVIPSKVACQAVALCEGWRNLSHEN